jgi:hypothetical protein
MQIECPVCLGSGQITYFKGVSRFVLSHEDCPECLGMGFLIVPDQGDPETERDPAPSPPPDKDPWQR